MLYLRVQYEDTQSQLLDLRQRYERTEQEKLNIHQELEQCRSSLKLLQDKTSSVSKDTQTHTDYPLGMPYQGINKIGDSDSEEVITN